MVHARWTRLGSMVMGLLCAAAVCAVAIAIPRPLGALAGGVGMLLIMVVGLYCGAGPALLVLGALAAAQLGLFESLGLHAGPLRAPVAVAIGFIGLGGIGYGVAIHSHARLRAERAARLDAQHAAERSERDRRAAARSAAHELVQPLGTIQNYAALIEGSIGNEAIGHAAQIGRIARQAAARLREQLADAPTRADDPPSAE